MRYFFEISYQGKNYNGWQSQPNPNAKGIQSVVEYALSKILQVETKTICSGRTDTGVHCVSQFFHADIEKEFDFEKFRLNLNIFLPKDIAILSIQQVIPEASARFDAQERSYRYQITKVKNPFLQELACHYFKVVDMPTMNKAAALLLGEQDFECFSKVNTDVNHFLCDIKKAEWKDAGDMMYFNITGNRFLRGMVRSIVGTLLDVGIGKTSLDEFQEIINSRDRKRAGANVPPQGLYLTKVKYPSSIFIKE